MTKNECPLGEDCDLLIAYKHGLSSAKDIIIQNGKLEAERDKLTEDYRKLSVRFYRMKSEREKLREALAAKHCPICLSVVNEALGETDNG